MTAAPKWTSQELEYAAAQFRGGASWPAIAATMGTNENAIRKAVGRAGLSTARAGGVDSAAGDTHSSLRKTGTADGALLIDSSNSPTVRTLDDLLAVCEVDLLRWTVERWTANKWDNVMRGQDGEPALTELYQVKAWLRPIPGANAAAELVAALVADMRQHSPVYPRASYPAVADSGQRHMAVIAMADLHQGAYAWGPESGDDYDADLAERLAMEAADSLLRKVAPYSPEEITLLFAGDILHADRTIDGKGGSTTKGTPQEVDGRLSRTYRIATRTIVGIVDAARAMAPARVVFRSGNHDELSLFMLGDLIAAWYRNDTAVSVENSPAPRVYQQYGATLLGYCHGHNEKPEKLPILMASEAPREWAETEYHEWISGHLHRRGVLMSEESGVQMHTAPALCPPDSWHAAKGLRHRRSSVAYVYHYDDGPVAQLTFNVRRAA